MYIEEFTYFFQNIIYNLIYFYIDLMIKKYIMIIGKISCYKKIFSIYNKYTQTKFDIFIFKYVFF